MLEAELDNYLGYAPYKHTDVENSRNGKKQKKIRSKYGEMDIEVPQDRNSSFEPIKKIHPFKGVLDMHIFIYYICRKKKAPVAKILPQFIKFLILSTTLFIETINVPIYIYAVE